MSKLFVTATGQNVGKTAFTVGLLSALRDELGDVGYMKPIGQRYVTRDGIRVDEDAALIMDIFDLSDDPSDISPIIVDRGFTREHLDLSRSDELALKVRRAFERIQECHDSVVLEGAGKSSVGECFGFSNMKVAEMVDAPVILLAEGGIGSTIDDCLLHALYLRQYGVNLLGVVINKVYKDKYDEIVDTTARGLEQRGLSVLGVIPYEPELSFPTLRMLSYEMDVERLTLKDQPEHDKNIGRMVVGTMKPHRTLGYMRRGELLITGGDREDTLIAVLCRSAMSLYEDSGFTVSGIVVTGGIRPHDSIIDVAEKLGILILMTEDDTYATLNKIRDLTVKLRPEDTKKLGRLIPLIKEHVDIERIMS